MAAAKLKSLSLPGLNFSVKGKPPPAAEPDLPADADDDIGALQVRCPPYSTSVGVCGRWQRTPSSAGARGNDAASRNPRRTPSHTRDVLLLPPPVPSSQSVINNIISSKASSAAAKQRQVLEAAQAGITEGAKSLEQEVCGLPSWSGRAMMRHWGLITHRLTIVGAWCEQGSLRCCAEVFCCRAAQRAQGLSHQSFACACTYGSSFCACGACCSRYCCWVAAATTITTHTGGQGLEERC